MFEQLFAVRPDDAEGLDVGRILSNIRDYTDFRNEIFINHALYLPTFLQLL